MDLEYTFGKDTYCIKIYRGLSTNSVHISEIERNEQADLEVKNTAIKPTISRLFYHRSLKSAHTRYIKVEQTANGLNSGKKT